MMYFSHHSRFPTFAVILERFFMYGSSHKIQLYSNENILPYTNSHTHTHIYRMWVAATPKNYITKILAKIITFQVIKKKSKKKNNNITRHFYHSQCSFLFSLSSAAIFTYICYGWRRWFKLMAHGRSFLTLFCTITGINYT